MGNRSNDIATIGNGADDHTVLQSREDWRCAREALKDLQSLGTRPTNLLLEGSPGAVRIILDMLWLELREPILRWHPGQPIDLPSPEHAATLVVHDASELTSDDQRRLLRWLDETAGRIRVVSTSAEPLWPRVTAGAFNDVLFYRLNTVCVNLVS